MQDYMRAKYDQLPRSWLYNQFVQHFSKWSLNQQICSAVSYAVLLYRGEPPTTRGQYSIVGTGLVNQPPEVSTVQTVRGWSSCGTRAPPDTHLARSNRPDEVLSISVITLLCLVAGT